MMTYLILVNFSIKKQKARLEEPSNNISEKLTGRKPVSERSERASGYNVGFATDWMVM